MNALNREIKKGEELIVRKDRMLPEYSAIEQRVFIAEDGFGLLAETTGRKISGHWKSDGQEVVILGTEISIEETIEWQKTKQDPSTAV